MICFNCNKELKDDTVFCRCCGTKLNPSDLDLLDKSLYKMDSEFYFKRAKELTSARKFNDALEYFAKAVELSPNEADIYNARGVCYSKMLCCQRLDFKTLEALEDFNTALKLYPESIQTLINIGRAEIGLRKHKDAIATFKKVLVREPLNIEALTNSAFAKMCVGDYKGVKKDTFKVFKIIPDHPYCLYIYGLSLFDQYDYRNAIATLKKSADKGFEMAFNKLKNTKPIKYLIVAEVKTKGFIMHIISDEAQAKNYFDKLSNLSHNYPFGKMYNVVKKLKFISSYEIKGNESYLITGKYQSSDGDYSVSLLEIDINTFCLKSFMKERENHSSVFEYNFENNEEIEKLEKISEYTPNSTLIAN